jgi:cytochrome c peroxidase
LGAPFSAGSTWSDDATEGTARRAGIPATMPESTRAAFRTPALRGVAATGPYMHSGQLTTLADVVDFYDRGGDTPAAGTKEIQPLNLTVAQKADLVNFLKALTGDAVPPALLVDTSQ